MIAMGGEDAIDGRFPAASLTLQGSRTRGAADIWEGLMKLPRRQFLHLAAGAAGLPAVSQIATTQT